jgi:nucleoside-diphosphate-sugar epimerase
VLINANGNSKKYLAERDPVADFDASVRSVRQSLTDFPCRCYVYLSSCDVYPDCSSPATTAESSTLDPARQTTYGFHKYLAEQCVRHQAPDGLVLRLGGFVGPGLRKNAVFDILRGGPLYLDPDSALQYLNVDWAAATTLDLIDRGVRGEIFNLCGRGVVGLREIVEWTGRSPAVTPGSPRVRYEIDIRKIAAIVDVPESRTAVRAFVRDQAARPMPA